MANEFLHESVTPNSTYNQWRLCAVWLAGLICLPTFMLGVTLASQMSLTDALCAVLIGQLLVTCGVCLTGVIGAKTGLTSASLLRITFGETGALLSTSLIAICLLGWFGFQTELFADSVSPLISAITGMDLPRPLLIALSGLMMSTTAIIGFRALEVLSRICLALLTLLFLLGLYSLFQLEDPSSLLLSAPHVSTLPVGVAVSLLAGGISVGMITAPDVTRFAISPRQAVVALVVASLGGAPLILMLCMLFSLSLGGSSNVLSLFVTIGGGSWVLLVFALATWTTNDSNVYLSSLALSSAFKRARLSVLAACSGLAGTLVALTGIVQNFVPWLSLLAVTFSPAAALLVVDYLSSSQRYSEALRREEPALRLFPMLCWILGIVVGVATTPAAQRGLDILTLTTVPALDGALVAGLLGYIGKASALFFKPALKCECNPGVVKETYVTANPTAQRTPRLNSHT